MFTCFWHSVLFVCLLLDLSIYSIVVGFRSSITLLFSFRSVLIQSKQLSTCQCPCVGALATDRWPKLLGVVILILMYFSFDQKPPHDNSYQVLRLMLINVKSLTIGFLGVVNKPILGCVIGYSEGPKFGFRYSFLML